MRRALLFFLLLPAAFAQPRLLVNNAATFVGTQPARIAPRSVIQARLDPAFGNPFLGNPGPAPSLDLSQSLILTIQPEGSEPLDVEILLATSLDVLALVPDTLPVGPATLTLTYNGGAMSSGLVEIVPTSFALFTAASGTGPAVAQNVVPGASIEFNALTRPARPGQYVTLWGTGLGYATQEQVSVVLGGRPVPIQFAGPSPQIGGLDQINIFVPFDEEIEEGCYVPLRVDVRDEPGTEVSISKVDAAGSCTHPLGLSEQQMQQLDAGSPVPIGRITIYSEIGTPVFVVPPPADANMVTRIEQAAASFLAMDAARVAVLARPVAAVSPGCRLEPAPSGWTAAFLFTGVSAGDRVSVSGPENRLVELLPDLVGASFYSSSLDPPSAVADPADLPPPVFVPGEWEFSAPGSSEAEAFRVRMRLPPTIEVTNFQELRSIEISVGMTVTWKADGYQESDTMRVQLLGRQAAVIDGGSTTRTLSVDCGVPALGGQITIGPELLQEFEASGPGLPTILALSLVGPSRDESLFSIELTSGEVIPGLVSYSLSESLPVVLH